MTKLVTVYRVASRCPHCHRFVMGFGRGFLSVNSMDTLWYGIEYNVIN
jgi:hypothetical protein